MSSRQLRKLQKQRELEAKAGRDSEGSDGDASDDEIAPVVAKPRANLFAALAGGEAEAEAEGDDVAEESEELGQDEKAADPPLEESTAPTAIRKNKKKKKKKSKKNKAAAPAQDAEHSGDDEIDRAIKELKIEPRAQDGSSPDNASTFNNLLKTNTYNLKVAHEMRNLFGRDVIESAVAEEGEQRRGARRRGMPQQMDIETFLKWPTDARKLPEISRKRNVFIHGREHWPLKPTGGLSMKDLGKTSDGTGVEYTFVHNQEYDNVQTMFFVQVLMGDPMRMVYLLKKFPYHVSTLLQVSSVAKQDQNMALSAELCERALFSFGRVALSSFKRNLEHGMARLDFRRPENRQFWLAGYHYIKSLIRKGTYKTALEWAKLLYSLDRSDPYAMRHLIHSLAIRAHESDWLLDFLAQIDTKDGREDTAYLVQSRVLARLQLGDTERARQDLVDGLRRVPWLYCALFQALSLDTPPSIWGINAEAGSRAFLTKLYQHQVGDLWNNPQAKALLQDVAKSIDRVDTDKLTAAELPIDMGIARLVFLDGETSLLALLPWNVLDQQPNYEFDPLPPAEEDNIFTGEGCMLPWREQQPIRGHPPDALEEFFAQVDELVGQPRIEWREEEEGFAGNQDAALDYWANSEAEDEDVGLEQNVADEEGLEQNIVDEASEGNQDEGIMNRFMQLFGFGRNAGAADSEAGRNEAAREEEEEDDDDELDDAMLPLT